MTILRTKREEFVRELECLEKTIVNHSLAQVKEIKERERKSLSQIGSLITELKEPTPEFEDEGMGGYPGETHKRIVLDIMKAFLKEDK